MTTHSAGPADPAVPSTPPTPPLPPSSGPPEPRAMTARSPEDLLAAVPEILGFEPSESVVMLTFGGVHTFHARAPLPPAVRADRSDRADGSDRDGEVELLVRQLLEPAVRHRVRGVVLVVYSADETLAGRVLGRLERAFVGRGITVTLGLRTDGRRWWAPGAPRHGVPYDVSSHPFRVESVLRGVVTHRSREELAATLAPDEEAADRVAARLHGVQPLGALGLAACVGRLVSVGKTFPDGDLAAAVLGLGDRSVRDAAWSAMRRDEAESHVRLWSDAVRRTPADLVGAPAAVLAFAAWLAGHGALAWCAVDRAVAVDPDNTLAALVSDLLEAAVPPMTWEESPCRPAT